MGLTKFIKEKDVNEKLREIIRDVKMEKEPDVEVPSGKNDLVGIAFDYFLRIYAQRLNHNYFEKELIAKKVLPILGPCHIEAFDLDTGELEYEKNEHSDYALDTLKDLDVFKKNYLKSGQISDNLLICLLKVSQFDLIYRSHIFLGYFKQIEDYQVDDLRKIVMNIKESYFRSKQYVIGNPSFGKASRLVGGADGDLIIDQKMVEIKTVKSTRKWKEYLIQLLAYYAILEHGGVDGISFSVKIDTLSIYFSRHAKMVDFPLINIFRSKNEKESFVKWIVQRMSKD
jgi:hypothetical protein